MAFFSRSQPHSALEGEVNELRAEVARQRELLESSQLARLALSQRNLRGRRAPTSAARKSQVRSKSDVVLDGLGGPAFADRQMMNALYQAYLQNPWISGPFDAIAARICSGGFDVVPTATATNPDPAERERIMDLLLYCNDQEEFIDVAQRSILSDLIFGRFYNEIAWAAGLPAAIFYADPVTIEPKLDDKGTIEGFIQRFDIDEPIEFDLSEIVYGVRTGPRGERLSPIQKLFTSHIVYVYMMRWSQKFFEHGAKPLYTIKLADKSRRAEAEEYLEFWEENYAGVENAHRDPITYGGAELVPLGGSSVVEMDFLNSIKYVREEFFSVIGIPPSETGVSDNGSRLTDNSGQLDKQFRNNTLDPLRRCYEDKWTYSVIRRGMGITDWKLALIEANYENDQLIVDLIIQKVNAGLMSREAAAQRLGDPKLKGPGADVPAISLAREIVPVSDLATVHGSQFTAAQQAAATKGMDPHAKPSDLAAASPADPTDPPPPPVIPNTTQPVGKPKDGDLADDGDEDQAKNESVADLARWQRIAVRAKREGRPQPAFITETLPATLTGPLAAALETAEDTEAVRRAFDAAFVAVRAQPALHAPAQTTDADLGSAILAHALDRYLDAALGHG